MNDDIKYEYASKKELKQPKQFVNEWFMKVHKYMKKTYHITFTELLTGSGKRNMVIKKKDNGKFDLDYQIIIQKNNGIKTTPKEIKMAFMEGFKTTKSKEFKDGEDSTQAITIEKKDNKFSIDVIITKEQGNEFMILRNNKNQNGNNNNDYAWVQRKDMSRHATNYKKVVGAEMWKYLREEYLRLKIPFFDVSKDDANYKASYQLLHEAVNNTLENFNIDIE